MVVNFNCATSHFAETEPSPNRQFGLHCKPSADSPEKLV
jgi:hypothetical protein